MYHLTYRRRPVRVVALVSIISACGGKSRELPPPSQTLPSFGTQQCQRYGQIQLPDQYMIQNNVWNDDADAQSQCVEAHWSGQGNVAGLTVGPVEIEIVGPTPASFPSIVYGWHWGSYYGAYKEALPIGEAQSVPSEWRFRVPDGARYDAAYDVWLHPDPAPSTGAGAIEVMIWVSSSPDVTPLGAQIGEVSLAEATWEIWYGPNGDFSTLTYRRTENVSEASLDILPFVVDGVSRTEATDAWYLLGVQAGFEIWRASSPLTTERYTVRIE